MSTELAILQTVRLKGRTTPEDVAAATGLSVDEVTAGLSTLVAAGNADEANGKFRMSKPGRDHLKSLLDEERKGVDQENLKSLYHEFDDHNSTFKQLITDWQMKDENTPNDHTDAAYDEDIVRRLGELDAGFQPLLGRLTQVTDRLQAYPPRFEKALAEVRAGEHSYIARPIIDSYHTVWFELHEDLIGLGGLNREDEAAAGRAQ